MVFLEDLKTQKGHFKIIFGPRRRQVSSRDKKLSSKAMPNPSSVAFNKWRFVNIGSASFAGLCSCSLVKKIQNRYVHLKGQSMNVEVLK